MKRLLLGGLLAAGLMSSPAMAAGYDGDWEGVLQAGPTKLRLELHVKTEGGQTTAVLDSLDQNATIPSTAAKVEDGELDILFLGVGGELKGKLSADSNTLEGSWTQGRSLPLTLTRKAAK